MPCRPTLTTYYWNEKRKLAASSLRKAESATIQECTNRSLHWWQRTTEQPTTEMIDKKRNAIRQCIHGTLRHEYRKTSTKGKTSTNMFASVRTPGSKTDDERCSTLYWDTWRRKNAKKA